MAVAFAAACASSPSEPEVVRYAVSGSIVDAISRAPLTAARVEVLDGANQGRSAATDSQGRYALESLEGGSFSLRASSADAASETRAIVLAANQTVDFALTRSQNRLAGTVIDATTDSALSGVRVEVEGFAAATTGADGTFGFDASDPEALRAVTLSSPTIVTRATHARAPGPAATLSVIPASFDLTAFDEMFRSTSGYLHRWVRVPPVIAVNRVLQFTNITDSQYVALSATMTDAEVTTLLGDLEWALPQLTGNTFATLSDQRRETAAAGASVQVSRPGSIVVARYQGLSAATGYWGYTRWAWNANGEVSQGIVMIDRDFDASSSPFRRSLRAHEFGHALGYTHVTSRTSVMNSDARTEPNAFDRAGAKLAFRRPTLNLSPDTDPAPYSNNLTPTNTLFWDGSP